METVATAEQIIFLIALRQGQSPSRYVCRQLIHSTDLVALQEQDLLTVSWEHPAETITITAKGEAYVEYILDLPLPIVQTFYIFNDPEDISRIS